MVIVMQALMVGGKLFHPDVPQLYTVRKQQVLYILVLVDTTAAFGTSWVIGMATMATNPLMINDTEHHYGFASCPSFLKRWYLQLV
jgi:uncharacterized membrane protein